MTSNPEADASPPLVTPSAADLAQEALRLARITPSQAERLGRTAERVARRQQDWSAVAAARRARGVAALQLRRLDAAAIHLQTAIEAAEQAGDQTLAGQARMTLASVLVLRGSPDDGFAALREALTLLTGVEAAQARMQRASMLCELGRFDEALTDLRVALPTMRRAGDASAEVRILSNRSMIHNVRRQFQAAEADLRRAQRICEQNHLDLYAAYVDQNLGCVLADRGDVPAALQQFDRAATGYQTLGMQVGSLHLDQSKLLLSVRLTAEARASAEEAEKVFLAQHRKVNVPEAQLLLSTTALLQRDYSTALAAAEAASRGFDRLGRTEWLTLADYAVVQARVAIAQADADPLEAPAKRRRTALIRRLRLSADRLEQAGWTVPALDARILAARLALEAGAQAVAREELAAAAQARRSGPADVRSRAWLAEALLRDSQGSRRGARAALRAGVRVVEDYRAALGASELRATAASHRGALATAGLRMALRDGKAQEVHWWAERGRATVREPRSLRPPADEALADLLQSLRTTMAESEAARTSGQDTAALVARQVELEEQIRQRSRQSTDDAGLRATEPPTAGDLTDSLGDAAYVEYVRLAGVIHAVTLVAGRMRLHTLGEDTRLRHGLQHLPFALRRLAHPRALTSQVETAASVVDRATSTLAETLLDPLLHVLGDRPLVIIPTSSLQSVPWSLVRGCAGRPISLAPSAALWLAAARREPTPGARIAAIAGPGLPAAAGEARAVAALHPGSTTLIDPDATAKAVARLMDGAAIIHVAAHGMVRSDNPLFSSLLLSDGPYTVYDLERLHQTPHQVVLAACNTALSEVIADVEILGLSAALLRQQTATLVAPVVPIPDAETSTLVTAYHRRLRDGEPPAQALASAQQENSQHSPHAAAVAAAYVCLGAGHRPALPGGAPAW